MKDFKTIYSNIKQYLNGEKAIELTYEFDREFSPFAAGIEQNDIPALLNDKSRFRYYVSWKTEDEVIDFLGKADIINSYTKEVRNKYVKYIQDDKLVLKKEFFEQVFTFTSTYDFNIDGSSHMMCDVDCNFLSHLDYYKDKYKRRKNIDIKIFDINDNIDKYIDTIINFM